MSLDELKSMAQSGVQLIVSADSLKESVLALAKEMYERGYFDGVKSNADKLADKTYTRKEAAAEVGICVRTLDNWAAAKICEPTKTGGVVFYTRSQVEMMKGLSKYRKLS